MKIERLIHFHGISTRLGSFYASTLVNCVCLYLHFLHNFLIVCFRSELYDISSILSINPTLTDTITPSQSMDEQIRGHNCANRKDTKKDKIVYVNISTLEAV